MQMLRTFLLIAASMPLHAIVTVDDPSNHVIGTGSVFDGVGRLVSSAGSCSAVLLGSGMHVLTAAHCVTTLGTTTPFAANTINVTFHLTSGTLTYAGTQLFVSPLYNAAPTIATFTGDLAILALDSLVDSLAQRYSIYRNSDELGQAAFVVGYGRSGVGTGPTTLSSGTKRSGQNVIDNVTGTNFLEADFDNGLSAQNATGGTGLGNDEVNTAAGDSGGPLFLFSGGSYLVAGIHSYGRCTVFDVDTSCSQSTPSANSTFGELFGSTRVSAYQTWVDSIVTPEPGSMLLLAAGLAFLAAKRRG